MNATFRSSGDLNVAFMAVGLPGSGESAPGAGEVDPAARSDAGRDVEGLLAVADVLVNGHVAVLVNLARVVQGAALAVLVEGVVDADDLAGVRVLDRRAGGAGDGVAGRRVADRVLPGPPVLAEPEREPVDVAVEGLPVETGHHADRLTHRGM